MIRIPATFLGVHWLVDWAYYLIDLLQNTWVGWAFRFALNLLGFGYVDDYVIEPFLELVGLEWIRDALEPLHAIAYIVEIINYVFHNVDFLFQLATLLVPVVKYPIYVYVIGIKPPGFVWQSFFTPYGDWILVQDVLAAFFSIFSFLCSHIAWIVATWHMFF